MFELLGIETITACNRRCSYCPNSLYDRGLLSNMKKMKTELYPLLSRYKLSNCNWLRFSVF